MQREKYNIRKKEQPRLNNKSSAVFLSIIIPIYNCEKYVSECLDSCLKQDLSYDEYEIICIDDGSTDKTPEILDMYAEKFNNINVLHKRNCGVSSARNEGIDKARGDYIWFVDADDLIQENILERIKHMLIERNLDIVMLKAFFFNNDLTAEEKAKKAAHQLLPSKKLITSSSVLKIFKRDIMIANNLRFFTGAEFGEDQLFNFEFFKYSKKDEIWDFPTYFCRKHKESTTQKGDANKRIRKKTQSLLNIIYYLYYEYQNGPECHKKRNVWYMLLLRKLMVDSFITLPIKDGLNELKRLEKSGVFQLQNNIPSIYYTKDIKFNPQRYLKRKHFHYVFKTRVANRLCHPIRSFKNFIKKFSKID